MRRAFILAAIGGAAIGGAAMVVAQQNQPGLPTLAQVFVINRDRNDAVPTTVVGEATVAVSPSSIVGVRSARQVWEYRRLVVPTVSDATPHLNTAGLEGWEAIESAPAGANTVWTLKRPR